MSVTDPIADMLTAIRNANRARKEMVEIPSSRIKRGIVEILKKEGYIRNFRFVEKGSSHKALRVYMRYTPEGGRVIVDLQRISKPSVRRYSGKKKIPSILAGIGVCIVTTNRGLMTDHQARLAGIGGELICKIW
jgi:small subunit ribosomal protein S8